MAEGDGGMGWGGGRGGGGWRRFYGFSNFWRRGTESQRLHPDQFKKSFRWCKVPLPDPQRREWHGRLLHRLWCFPTRHSLTGPL